MLPAILNSQLTIVIAQIFVLVIMGLIAQWVTKRSGSLPSQDTAMKIMQSTIDAQSERMKLLDQENISLKRERDEEKTKNTLLTQQLGETQAALSTAYIKAQKGN